MSLKSFIQAYSLVVSFNQNFLPLHFPSTKSLRIVVLEALGNISEIIIQKLLFMDLSGKSLNQQVRRITLSPKNAMDLFTVSKSANHPSALFVDPRRIVDAPIEDYTTVAVEFSRKVQIGAILFEMHRDDFRKNIRRIAVYSNNTLVFMVARSLL